MTEWTFDVSPETAVVTSTYVTKESMPVRYVSHEVDENGEIIWQFHCGNGDYDMAVMQLVGLGEIVAIDGSLKQVAGLPLGHSARRAAIGDKWVFQKE